MTNTVYTALTRQDGLSREMEVVANNLANLSTTGYKSDRAVFAEFMVDTGNGTSLSMGALSGHAFNLEQGALRFTGGRFDVAIQGEGFFVINTDQGERLTRAGHFMLSPEGILVDPMGNAVGGEGGGEITIPPEATNVQIAGDGTISADGQEIGRLGVVLPDGELSRDTGTYFSAEGFAPVPEVSVVQGALEQSNVSPVLEVARMIEVQRAYEAGQSLLEQENERIQQLIQAVRA